MGEFSVKVSRLESQYVLLRANEFYRNEVTGEKSNSPVTLYAFSDLSNRDEVNVNLLTHLAYERSLYLATGREPLLVATAKRQAEGEVFSSFAIEGWHVPSRNEWSALYSATGNDSRALQAKGFDG